MLSRRLLLSIVTSSVASTGSALHCALHEMRNAVKIKKYLTQCTKKLTSSFHSHVHFQLFLFNHFHLQGSTSYQFPSDYFQCYDWFLIRELLCGSLLHHLGHGGHLQILHGCLRRAIQNSAGSRRAAAAGECICSGGRPAGLANTREGRFQRRVQRGASQRAPAGSRRGWSCWSKQGLRLLVLVYWAIAVKSDTD